MKTQTNAVRQNSLQRSSQDPSSSSANTANSSPPSSVSASLSTSPEALRPTAPLGSQGLPPPSPREQAAPAAEVVVGPAGPCYTQASPAHYRLASQPAPSAPGLGLGPENTSRAARLCQRSQELHTDSSGSVLTKCIWLKHPGTTSQCGGCPGLSGKDVQYTQEEDLKRTFVSREEFLTVERELDHVREELKCLTWKVRHLGETVQPLAEESKRYNGYTLGELKAMVQFEKDPYKAAHKILMALFSDTCLLQHVAADQACNSKSLPKPKLDPELYTVYCHILQSIFPGMSGQALRERTQPV